MTDKFQMEAERHVKTISLKISSSVTGDIIGADVGAQLTMTLSSLLTCSHMITPELPERVEGPPGWPVNGIEERDPVTRHRPDCFLNQSPRYHHECTSVVYYPYSHDGGNYQERIFAH